jgi:hypothetical protein
MEQNSGGENARANKGSQNGSRTFGVCGVAEPCRKFVRYCPLNVQGHVCFFVDTRHQQPS